MVKRTAEEKEGLEVMDIDTFNVIGFLKRSGYIDGNVLTVPSMSKLPEEI
jgi:hypothetical protein